MYILNLSIKEQAIYVYVCVRACVCVYAHTHTQLLTLTTISGLIFKTHWRLELGY